MDARDATATNADLWTHYLKQQWSAFLDPFGLSDSAVAESATRTLAEVAAANMSSLLTMLLALPVTRMFETNAPAATHALLDATLPDEQIEIPAAYAANPRPSADLSQREEWSVTSPARETVGAY